MNLRHIACLAILVASIALEGCNNVDEAKARSECDKAKATDCVAPAKQSTDKNLSGIAKALKP